jgi:hypothetical protein
MIQEFFIALFKAGLPVALASYLLVWWALRNGYLGDVETVKDIEKEVKRLAKDEEGSKNGDPVHRKWLAMGGGFYGVVALITLILIELGEVLDFIADFDGIDALIDSLGVGFLIELIIETIRNSVIAIAWPAYWLTDIPGNYIWIWFIVAYGGYWLGSHLATRQFKVRETESG